MPSQFCSSSDLAATDSWEGESILSGTTLANSIRRLSFLPLTPTLLQSSGNALVVAGSNPAAASHGGNKGANDANASSTITTLSAQNVSSNASDPALAPTSRIVEQALNQRRHLKTGVDHSVFLFPTRLERFTKRFILICVLLAYYITDLYNFMNIIFSL